MRPAIVLLSLSILGPACIGGNAESPVKIAFVQDLSAPDADEHALPALQAVELAVAINAPRGSGIEVVPFDLDEDPNAVAQIAQDDSFLGAVVGPGADGAPLAEAGVPTVSVSTAGPTPTQGAWRRLVAPIDAVAGVLAMELAGSRPCVLSEEPPPDTLARLLAERLDAPTAALEDPGDAETFVISNGCDTVAWVGSPDAGAEVARTRAAGVAFVGGDRLLDPDFLDAGSEGDDARAVCSCADLSTSIAPAAMRFNQDYQAEFGLPPGAYAVEAWDAASLLLGLALHEGWDRRAIAAALDDLDRFEGLARSSRFGADGELADPGASIGWSELRAGRWVREAAPT